jgi:hypothetical protein
MRLGQLARKLSLRPAQIVEFLSQHNIQIEDNSNTRIEDGHTELVVNHFAPGTFEQVSEAVDEPEEITPVENGIPVVVVEAPQVETSEPPVNPDSEVIRVPKIELSGLKVLGKIELPEPKKKEPIAIEIEKTDEGVESFTETAPPPAPERKSKISDRYRDKKPVHQKRDRPREWKNPLELQREREIRQAEEKKRIAAEREKEKRKRHYEEKRKAVVQTKRTKPSKDQPIAQQKPVDTRPVPKTWLGKFLRWWTT